MCSSSLRTRGELCIQKHPFTSPSDSVVHLASSQKPSTISTIISLKGLSHSLPAHPPPQASFWNVNLPVYHPPSAPLLGILWRPQPQRTFGLCTSLPFPLGCLGKPMLVRKFSVLFVTPLSLPPVASSPWTSENHLLNSRLHDWVCLGLALSLSSSSTSSKLAGAQEYIGTKWVSTWKTKTGGRNPWWAHEEAPPRCPRTVPPSFLWAPTACQLSLCSHSYHSYGTGHQLPLSGTVYAIFQWHMITAK